eukprot:TRINITY_DN118039_c0_g1_i1.p1 TRINITY_DN118039_c0_g1~~TRINITY_DN118039_c0_g1_i1.p1  ORF type:complete len:207 (+),score=24.04 TRINITY_DN118039_c0_g1_i1:56-676(+)
MAQKKPTMEDLAVKIEPRDYVTMKRTLDEQIIKIVTDEGVYEIDKVLNIFKIVIGAIAVGFALLSQFYPLPFPKNRWLICVCAVTYFVLSGVLQLIASFVEKEVILVSKPTSKGSYVRISTNVPRFDGNFTITAESVTIPKSLLDANTLVAKIRKQIYVYSTREVTGSESKTFWCDKYFDENGVLYPPALKADLQSLVTPLKSKVA